MTLIALVTGASKGLSKEVARLLGRHGMTVLLGSRDTAHGEPAAAELSTEGLLRSRLDRPRHRTDPPKTRSGRPGPLPASQPAAAREREQGHGLPGKPEHSNPIAHRPATPGRGAGQG
jgi:NAD(P)-dependent dehydrogenase (short-subunit alcohol dehydrogenase family)